MITSKPTSKKYRENYDKVFKKYSMNAENGKFNTSNKKKKKYMPTAELSSFK